jgi:hypothetical protein
MKLGFDRYSRVDGKREKTSLERKELSEYVHFKLEGSFSK